MTSDIFSWDSVEMPLLELIALANREGRQAAIHAFFDEREVAPPVARIILQRLVDEGFVTGSFHQGGANLGLPAMMADVRLTGRGARTVGMWPSENTSLEFAAAIERLLARAENEQQRSQLQRLLDAARALPAQLLTEVVVQASLRLGGMG